MIEEQDLSVLKYCPGFLFDMQGWAAIEWPFFRYLSNGITIIGMIAMQVNG